MKDAAMKYATHDGSPLTERQIALLDALEARIDIDVLAGLRRFGPGYQTRINAILREKMNAESTAPASAS